MKDYEGIVMRELAMLAEENKGKAVPLTEPEGYRVRDLGHCRRKADLVMEQFLRVHALLLLEADDLARQLHEMLRERTGGENCAFFFGPSPPMAFRENDYYAMRRDAEKRANALYFGTVAKP